MAVWLKRLGAADLPVPEAVGVPDQAGRVVAWDLRATHTFLAEQGRKSDCDDICRANDCIVPAVNPVFRHMTAPLGGVGEVDEAVVEAWLDAHPHPIIVVPGRGGYEPMPGRTVTDVVRAAVDEGLL